MFQSTRPRGARLRIGIIIKLNLSFNPRAREGRDINASCSIITLLVSIHAPARGATGYDIARIRREKGFNPRAREGRDKTTWQKYK